jgi:hypothetical protein
MLPSSTWAGGGLLRQVAENQVAPRLLAKALMD